GRGAPGTRRQGGVLDPGSAAMAEAHADEPLVIVLAVRLPDALAAQKPPDEREGSVTGEGREDEHREPERPGALAPAEDAERAGEETERHRADVAHEDPRRREIEK